MVSPRPTTPETVAAAVTVTVSARHSTSHSPQSSFAVRGVSPQNGVSDHGNDGSPERQIADDVMEKAAYLVLLHIYQLKS